MKTSGFLHLIYYFFLLEFLFLACNHHENEIPAISVEKLIQDKLGLSDIVEDVKYINLNNNALISKIIDIESADSLFIIQNRFELLAFNNKGEFTNTIGKQGRGPNEYVTIGGFTVDNVNKKVYVIGLQNVYVYNYKGEFKYSFPMPGDTPNTTIVFKNNELYFPFGGGMFEKKYDWIITDTMGNITGTKINTMAGFTTDVDFNKNLMFEMSNELYYWDELFDTIYHVNGPKGDPAFLFANDMYRLKKEDMTSLEIFSRKTSWHLLSVLGSERCLVLRYGNSKDNEKVVTVFDQKTHKFYELNRTHMSGRNVSINNLIVLNDWDSGPAFQPQNKIKTKSGKWFIQWIDAIALQGIVGTNAFKNSNPKYPEKKKQLEQLANSLNENDNPVLMLVKLKE